MQESMRGRSRWAARRTGIVNDDRFKIFSGTANLVLAESICRHLNVPLGKALLGRFSDGEIYFQILENVRGADVFVVQPCHHPVDNHLLELLLMIDAFKRASAWRITAVLPYYCYARQDRKDKPRVPISAKLVADLLETAGASRALTLDLHAPQIQGYFNVPVDHLYASPVLVDYYKQRKLHEVTVVSPDAGGVERARAFAKKLDAPLAIVDKRRVDVVVSEVMHLIGDVRGRPALVIDDIIDTAGTLVKTAEIVRRQAAHECLRGKYGPDYSGSQAPRRTRQECGEASAPQGRGTGRAIRRRGQVPHAGGEREAARRDFAIAIRPQHHLQSEAGLGRPIGDAEGLAGGPVARFALACGLAARGHECAHARQGPGAYVRRAARREVAGRHLRNGYARGGDRMPAFGYPR